jgi:hypothetical protein
MLDIKQFIHHTEHLCRILCLHSSVITLRFLTIILNSADETLHGKVKILGALWFMLCGDSTALYKQCTEIARLLKTCSV